MAIIDLSADILQHLAHLRRQHAQPRLADPKATAEALAALPSGRKPGLGWWRQQMAPRATTDAPECPVVPWRPYNDTDLVFAAEDLADMPPEAAIGALADLAVRSELPPPSLRRAVDLYLELHGTAHPPQ